jgi:hypothetical protein
MCFLNSPPSPSKLGTLNCLNEITQSSEWGIIAALLHNDSAFRLKALLYNIWSIRAFN